ncbi:hypothetical protein [Algoriphagus terrigena]|uniref:hypothetical protein n=1 Tax=Algoriphagus terrigena TaxID=344884 RepID=UPI0004161B53|nr:hypothetical protein [Algoriphagus terrigena]
MSREFSDMDDKEFDGFLKEVSESPDIPFREEDWTLMKARLATANAKTSPAKWLTALVWMGVVSIVSLGIYFGGSALWEASSTDPRQEVGTLESEGEPEIGQIGDSNLTEEMYQDEKVALNPTPAKGDSGSSTSSITNLEKEELGTEVSVFADSREGKDGGIYSSDEFLESQTIELNYRPDLTQLAPQDLIPKGISFRSIIESEEKQPEDTKTKKWFSGRFNLSVQAAPDLSGVKLNQFGKAGQALGLGAEYFISPQFSVNSGVFYSHKPYESEGPFQMAYGEEVNGVIGDCGVLDIPINLRLYPLQGTLQRAFISMGFSSYLMLSETYEITYEDPMTGYEYTQTIEKNGENQHPFGVVNLSIGYERKLAERLSLQVEPYFKVPLDGVGEGNISLKSAGIFLGLKYYPGR